MSTARAERPSDCIAPSLWELSGLALIAGAYLLSYATLDIDTAHPINLSLPYVSAVILLLGAFRTAAIDPVALWTPLFWFRVTSAVFFCLGSVAHDWMNWYTRLQTDIFFPISPYWLARTNILSSCCIVLVLSAAALAARFIMPRNHKAVERQQTLLLLAATAACVLGYGVKYLVVFPHEMGQFGDRLQITLPGMLVMISFLAPPGLCMLTMYAMRRGGTVFLLPVALLTLDIVTGTLRFSKQDVLLPLMLFLLAVLSRKVTFARAGMATVLMVGMLAVLQPIIEYGRDELGQNYGRLTEGAFSDRMTILAGYFAPSASTSTAPEMQGALARISYINAIAGAMNLHDTGRADDTLSDATWVLIPRLLWPDKPQYDIGMRFNEKLTGMTTSSAWMGYFGESYLNWGWWGLLLMPLLGLELFALSRYALYVFETGRWLHVPAAFMGLTVGLFTDNALVGVAFVSAVTVVLLHLAAEIATNIVQATLRGSSVRSFEHVRGVAAHRSVARATRRTAMPVRRQR